MLSPYRAGELTYPLFSACLLKYPDAATSTAAHLFACIAFSVAFVVTMTAYLWCAPESFIASEQHLLSMLPLCATEPCLGHS